MEWVSMMQGPKLGRYHLGVANPAKLYPQQIRGTEIIMTTRYSNT
ncbi:hypothetical protein BH18THE2_BH18THE2_05120 [soil metagenome]